MLFKARENAHKGKTHFSMHHIMLMLIEVTGYDIAPNWRACLHQGIIHRLVDKSRWNNIVKRRQPQAPTAIARALLHDHTYDHIQLPCVGPKEDCVRVCKSDGTVTLQQVSELDLGTRRKLASLLCHDKIIYCK